ncbi:di-heme cytochrome-c peroxidase [Myxococcus stipitatus DSM 14675]|uniref:Di-heme cytochrome-c peroxidase n=1 Tax=Myxococcus stipitatus (strain DSM 14675 / JCM 12634 / Mx s8) TaxID=1278073 RepID=L7UIR7_MYXSD|nr:methanobactin export MATE transporter MbnM [Myxococcus stipitatus]AGC48866.1 di-heme cytochrome-c peroxidase [Myxococcus stipitatus DSM 14675]
MSPVWKVSAVAAAVVAAGCGDSGPEQPAPPAYVWDLPAGFPEPFVPETNPMSEAKVELGRHLFFDKRLSGNGTMACGSCHEQARAFSDGKATPVGSTGDAVPRNAPGLANVAYLDTYTWANPLLTTLESQALVPLFGEHPTELGLTSRLEEVLQRFREDARYPELFRKAFPNDADPVSRESIAKALASFQRTLLSGGSPYDRYLQGESSALSASARRGMELFFGERAECYHCHSGRHLSNSFRSKDSKPQPPQFFNTGLYDLNGKGAYPPQNPGLYEFTHDVLDQGRFRVPQLRNAELTAPYMHDGSIPTLEAVIEHYMAGGRNVVEGPYAGDGRLNPNKDPLVRPFELSDSEKGDLVAFLKSLTDTAFLTDPRFSNPWE